MHQKTKNQRMFQALCQVIPGGVNSPARAWEGMGVAPLVANRGKGDLLFDEDGNAYIDYCGSWGPLIHGHAHPKILQAVQKRMNLGTTFGMTTAIEEKLARKVVELVDSVEKIRFVSSGTEATMSAVRLARGYTKRDLILKFNGNFHGHADFFLVKAGSSVSNLSASSSAGIPSAAVQHVLSLPYNDLEICKKAFATHGDKIAAVIIEPIAANMGVVPASKEFLSFLRTETEQVGALLIFDEVISGFRVGIQGFQSLSPIRPDLTCFGKIIGGGFPVGAFGGKQEVMDHLAPLGPVFQSGTLSGNPVAMEAGYQALSLLEEPAFYEELQQKADLITQPIHEYLSKHDLPICLNQVGSLFTLFLGKKQVKNGEDVLDLDRDLFARFFRFLFSHGVLAPPSPYEAWFVSNTHTEEHLIQTRDLILQFLHQY